MRALVASLFRRVADRLDPVGFPTADRWVPFPSPEPVSSPIDFDALWRSQTADFGGYVDDGEEWRRSGGGGYL